MEQDGASVSSSVHDSQKMNNDHTPHLQSTVEVSVCSEEISKTFAKKYAISEVPDDILKSSCPQEARKEAAKDDHGLVAACEKGSLKAVKCLLDQYPVYYNDINKVYAGQYGVRF